MSINLQAVGRAFVAPRQLLPYISSEHLLGSLEADWDIQGLDRTARPVLEETAGGVVATAGAR
eukprot:6359339-Alexandrium_andersonii.AAC.1